MESGRPVGAPETPAPEPPVSERSPGAPVPPGWDGDEVFRRFESRTNLERTQPQLRLYRLERMEQLLHRLGSPERRLPVVHVAGSKGKGSTSAYIASLLAASGFTVGLYTSPHVTGYRERFTVIPPGKAVGDALPTTEPAATAITEGGERYEQALAEAGYELWRVVETMLAEGTDEDELPTTFELLTALAFLFFPRVPCDWLVLETGLGGRLDATNVCRPEVSVITRIELEHTDYLGDTIAKIAAEKAGIIKEGIPVVSAVQRPEAAEVFERVARERSAPLTVVHDVPAYAAGDDQATAPGEANRDADAPPANTVSWRGDPLVLPEWAGGNTVIPRMIGAVQRLNIAQALAVYRLLTGRGTVPAAPATAIAAAIGRCALPGRGEIAGDLFLDGAHTPESVSAVVAAYRRRFGADVQVPVILGVVAGKDVEGIAAALRDIAPRVIVSTPGSFKPGDPADVADRVRRGGAEVELIPGAEDALERARELRETTAFPAAPILVTGSFYMVAELRRRVISF